MRDRVDRGASVVEFGLLVALLAVVIVGAASVAGGAVGEMLSTAVSAVTG